MPKITLDVETISLTTAFLSTMERRRAELMARIACEVGVDAVTRKALYRVGKAMLDLEEVVLVAAKAGRDLSSMSTVKADLLTCFSKNGRHGHETLARRYFRVKYSTAKQDDFVRSVLRLLKDEGKVRRVHHGKHTYATAWKVVTPEEIAAKKEAKEEQAKNEAARKVRKARREAIIDYLKAKGYESGARAMYGHGVSLSLDDFEQLLGLEVK